MEEGDRNSATETEAEGAAGYGGVIGDLLVGALGGLLGIAAMTPVLFAGEFFGVFEFAMFTSLAEVAGIVLFFLPISGILLGYAVFLLGGVFVWPQVFASMEPLLPGNRIATSGMVLGAIIWTGFALAFFPGYEGPLHLVGYLTVTLLAHLVYGFVMGSVLDVLLARQENFL